MTDILIRVLHLFVEGAYIQEVSPEFAQGRVNAGAWYLCDAAHTLPDQFKAEQTTVYHRNFQRRTA